MMRPGASRCVYLFPGLSAVLCLLLWLPGCGSSGGGIVNDGSRLEGKNLERANRLYGQLQREVSLGRDRKSLELSATLLDYYPTFNRNDEVLVLALEASDRLGDSREARALGDELLGRYPTSPMVDKTLLRLSDLCLADADTFSAVKYLVRYHNRDPLRGTMQDGRPRGDDLMNRLTPAEVGMLMDQEEGGPLWSYLGHTQLSMLVHDGRYAEAEQIGGLLREADLGDRWTIDSLALLQGEGAGSVGLPHRPTVGRLNMDQIGVLCPLTGRYAVLGNAFYDGVLLAIKAANQELDAEYVPLVEDTGADPVTAALGARRLAAEDGCGALFGSMMSGPTSSVALVADIYGVPLVSPTATNDKIWELGDGIFQTNLTGVHEVRLLAQLATTILLKKRFAILHENTSDGEGQAMIFKAEVEKFGGQVVAIETYNLADTDFRKAILGMKKERPEVIFTPATVDQMILLAPQLDFYKAGALVMGLSHWNSPRLFERASTVLERAIFPSELALFPSLWTGHFNAGFDSEKYPREATALALKSYQGMRLLLDTLSRSGAVNRSQLKEALELRLASRDIESEGPESFASTVRVFRGQRALPFPSGIFVEAWELTDGAVADTLSTVPDESMDYGN